MPSPKVYVVKGKISQGDLPLSGVVVRAYIKDLRNEKLLDEISTLSDGIYKIEYTAQKFFGTEGNSGGLYIRAYNKNGKEIGSSPIRFKAGKIEEINLEVPGDVRGPSEWEVYLSQLKPALKDVQLQELTSDDLDFLTGDTGISREHLLLMSLAAQRSTSSIRNKDQNKVQVKVQTKNHSPSETRIPIELFYGCFRQGLPSAPDTFLSPSVDELIVAIKNSVKQKIIPGIFGRRIKELRTELTKLKVNNMLEPANEGSPGSLGDLLGTMLLRLSAEKVRVVAASLSNLRANENNLCDNLKKAKFKEKEISDVQLTMTLGELTQNHIPLVKELQSLRDNTDASSLVFLASRTPSQWQEMAFKHNVPPSFPGSPQAYAEQLERTVEEKYPTAVFAARVKGSLLELPDSRFKEASDFLIQNPELELSQHNVRGYINEEEETRHNENREHLIDTLQRIQRAQKLTNNWRETGSLLSNDFHSALDIVHEGRDKFVKTVTPEIPLERAEVIFEDAKAVHNTTIALIGSVAESYNGGTFRMFTDAKNRLEHPAMKNYPNLRKLFGNLDTCECKQCRSVLSPAAYLVDLLRFIDNKTVKNSPISVLLSRRPDIADLELNCANTRTEIPYVDLVLEILENEVGLAIDIPPPYGFNPEVDFSHKQIDPNVDKALRLVLSRSAISIGEEILVKEHDWEKEVGKLTLQDGISRSWTITDGARSWGLRYWSKSFTATEVKAVLSQKLKVTDFDEAITSLDAGTLPYLGWLNPIFKSTWDKNIPSIGNPIVTLVEKNTKWKVEFSRANRVEIIMAAPNGSVIIKTVNGQTLDSTETITPVLQALVAALNGGKLAEPLISMLPSNLEYHISKTGNQWEIAARGEKIITYHPERLQLTSLTYQSSDSHSDLKASPENLNPEAYNKLDASFYPWGLPFNLWLEEVRVFLENLGIPRRQLMEQSNPSSRLLDDKVADSIANEVLGLSASEAGIIAPSSVSQSPWEYWGLQESGNILTDFNDESTVTGSWVQVLSRVSILLQRAGLTYEELLDVLETHYVNKGLPTLTITGEVCNLSKRELVGLKSEHLIRIHRMVRLWRKLSWTVFELDNAISAVTDDSMDLTPDTLRGLSHMQRLYELLKLPIGVIASWFGKLILKSYSYHKSDKRQTVESVYDQLFLNPLIQNPPDQDFKLDQLSSTTKTLVDKITLITAVFGIHPFELLKLINACISGNTPALSLSNLTTVYKNISLSKALNLTVTDYIRALDIIDNNPFKSPKRLVTFVEAVKFIQASNFNFTLEEIDYLLHGVAIGDEKSLFTVALGVQTLTDLRFRLQLIHTGIFNSAEPLAERVRRLLAQLGWYQDQYDVAINLLGSSPQLEFQFPTTISPSAINIPTSLREWVSYLKDEHKIIVSGLLAPNEWTILINANGVTGVKNAIITLQNNADSFLKAALEEQHLLQSFLMPVHKVTYNTSTPPTIPTDIGRRCFYDQSTHEIVLSGWVTKDVKEKLKGHLTPSIIQQLQTKSDQYQEQSADNLFLLANEIEMLFRRGQVPDSRYQFLLEKLAARSYLEATAEIVGTALGMESQLLHILLLNHLDRTEMENAFLDENFIKSDPRVIITGALFGNQFAALAKIHKAGLICTKLGIKPAELPLLPTVQQQTSGALVYDTVSLDDLPIKTNDTPLSYENFQNLVQLFELLDKPGIGTTFLAEILQPVNATDKLKIGTTFLAEILKHANANDKTNLQRSISKVFQISEEDVANICDIRLNLKWYDDYLKPSRLVAMVDLLLTMRRFSTKASEVFSLIKENPGIDEAALARSMMRSQFDATSWPARLRPIVDVLREKRRGALVSYLVTDNDLRDATELYDHYLVDVEMGPCKVSTRILLAISAVQLFVQRCLLNMEEVSPSSINAKRWEWMRNYRVWEANRKVFLYPENWIEPDLRDDKSEIFKELEGQLSQNELDNSRAKEIVNEYLKQLEDISQLVIVGMYVERVADPVSDMMTSKTIVHIVARTHNRPSRLFYRLWVFSPMVNYWTPWEHVPLDGIKTEHILPFVMRGDTYIAWPEFTQLPVNSDETASTAPKWRLQMSWIKRTNSGWSDRFMSADTLEHPWLPGKDENRMFTFRSFAEFVTEQGESSAIIQCYAASDQAEDYSSISLESNNLLEEMINVKWDEIPLDTPLLWVHFKGRVVAKYTVGGNKLIRSVPGAVITFSIQFVGNTSDEITDAKYWFNREYDHVVFWEKMSAPGPDDPRRLQMTITTDSNGEYSDHFYVMARALYKPNVMDNIIFKVEVVSLPPVQGWDLNRGFASSESWVLSSLVGNSLYRHMTLYRNFQIEPNGSPTRVDTDRPLPMNQIGRFILKGAEDATFTPIGPIELGKPANLTEYGSGYLCVNAEENAYLIEPKRAISLWKGVAKRYYILPAFPFTESGELLSYSDSVSTYFILRQLDGESEAKYQIFLANHPRVGYLRRVLSRQGVETLFGVEQQTWSDPKVFGNHSPTNVIDPDPELSITQPAIRFEPDEARAPYACYNTELFFHIPFLIATYLSRNQRFEDAQKWLHFIFNPTTDDTAPENTRYWRYLPFRNHSNTRPIDNLLELLAVSKNDQDKSGIWAQIDAWLENPFRPHTVARLRPRAYEFAVVFRYLDNLIAAADRLFNQSTTESINEATLLYITAAKLVGPRPRTLPRIDKVTSLTYRLAAENLDSFSNAWCEIESMLPKKAGMSGNTLDEAGMLTRTSGEGSKEETEIHSISSIGMLYFCIPGNEKLQTYWQTVEDRLFNIRNCRNIEGVEQNVELWQPPIDPGLLVRAAAAGLDVSTVLSELNVPLPYYRFNVLAQKALEVCSQLKELGGTLLSLLEKKDVEQLARLRSSQEIDLLKLVSDVKQQQIEEAKANIGALHQSEQLSIVRFMQYQRLLGNSNAVIPDDPNSNIEQTSMVKAPGADASGDLSGLGIIKAEKDQIDWSDIAMAFGITAGIHSAIAGICYAIPQTYSGTPVAGVEFGGLNIGSIFNAGAAFWNTQERKATQQSGKASTIAQYQRRQDEWVFQSRLALKELGQVRKQIIASEIRFDIAEKELKNHEKQIENAKDVDKFMRQKYTNQELYRWMVGQVSELYFKSYQLAYETAKRAERAFRHELGLQESNFIKFGYWDNLKKGLMAGDRLFSDIKRMELAYLQQNRREYEIIKHISLLQIDPAAWLLLKGTGRCEIQLLESLFDLDYPGHYMRRIKSVSITVPCVVGPYTSINCTLSLLDNRTRVKNSTGNPYFEKSEEDDDRFVTDFTTVRSIATSHAQNDSGMFELNFKDERYLPFEGAGVISRWRIDMPKENNAFDFATISDIIIHFKYTARDGGELFKDKAKSALHQMIKDAIPKQFPLARLFSLKHEFPDSFYRLVHSQTGSTTVAQTTEFKLEKNHFPYFFSDKNVTMSSLTVYLKPKGDDLKAGIKLLVNSDNIESWTQDPASGNLLKSEFDKSGSPIKKWTIKNTGTSLLDEDTLDDILILIRYKILSNSP